MNSGQPETPAAGARGKPDRWIGIVLIVLCGFLFYETFFFRTFDWDPVGMAFWPRVLLAVIAAVSVWHIIVGNAGGTAEPLSRRAFVVFAGAMVYVALLETVGFLILTPIAIFAYSLWLRPLSGRAVLWGVVLAGVGTAALYFLFQEGMTVYLPAGFLE